MKDDEISLITVTEALRMQDMDLEDWLTEPLLSASDTATLQSALATATDKQQWTAAKIVAEHLMLRNIRSPETYSRYFDALLNLNELKNADAALDEGLEFFPDSYEIKLKRARLSTLQHNYSVASKRWLALSGLNRDSAECYLLGAFCLRQNGDSAGALELLHEGMSRLPIIVDLWLDYIATAIEAGDTDAARTCWRRRKHEFSDDHRTRLSAASLEYADGNLDAASICLNESVTLMGGKPNQEQLALAGKLWKTAMKAVLLNFESLGGLYEGCEFGLVQRAYGVEPLGLLRWAGFSPEGLIDALESKFEGVGEAESTILQPPNDSCADWRISNARYGMSIHTFRTDPPTDENYKRLFEEFSKYLRYLKIKLMEDLREGAKMFVYKLTYDVLSDAYLERLNGAISAYGPSTLLYVRRPDKLHPAGTVELRSEGLIIGYIERFSFGFGCSGKYIGPATECWEPIVAKAYEVWLDQKPSSGIDAGAKAALATIKGINYLGPLNIGLAVDGRC